MKTSAILVLVGVLSLAACANKGQSMDMQSGDMMNKPMMNKSMDNSMMMDKSM